MIDDDKRKEKLAEMAEGLRTSMAMSIGLGFVSVVLLLILANMRKAGYFAQGFWDQQAFQELIDSNQIMVMFAAITLAYLLYILRLYRVGIYGFLEIVFGTCTIFLATQDFLPQVDKFIPIFGGIYIIIRGLDNMSKAVIKGSLSEIAWNMMFSGGPKK